MKKLRVYHIPQVPGKPFYVPVKNEEEALLVMDTLAIYDQFQYQNNIKPSYSNACGVEMFDNEEDEWIEYCDDEGNSFDQYCEINDIRGNGHDLIEINDIRF
jgi:hypothetical protein